jgi:YbgC/YbaW family acyl-CoA thioester hydrolase
MADEPRFTTTCRVQFVDTDMAGIAHFSNYYRYMEQAEAEFFRKHGENLVRKQPDGTNVGWPRVGTSCRYHAPAYYDDILDVKLFVHRRGVKSVTLNFEFWREETLLANGQMKTVYCRFAPGQPIESIEIPDTYDKMFGPV